MPENDDVFDTILTSTLIDNLAEYSTPLVAITMRSTGTSSTPSNPIPTARAAQVGAGVTVGALRSSNLSPSPAPTNSARPLPIRSPGRDGTTRPTARLVISAPGSSSRLPVTPSRKNGRTRTIAVSSSYYCLAMAALPPRSTYFWIFPVAVLGNSSMGVNDFGTLK